MRAPSTARSTTTACSSGSSRTPSRPAATWRRSHEGPSAGRTSDAPAERGGRRLVLGDDAQAARCPVAAHEAIPHAHALLGLLAAHGHGGGADRKSTRLNSSHPSISYAVFCLK